MKVDAAEAADGVNVIAEVFDSSCPADGTAGLACGAGADGAEADFTFDAVGAERT